jgi:predicted RNase H-like HicB family nuclease
LGAMSESLDLTIVFEEGEQDWVLARVLEVPGALSQGRTREEARENVIDALRLMLRPDDEELAGIPADSRESLELRVGP